MVDITDKRKHPRQFCSVPVYAKEGTEFANTQTIDISEGGLGLLASQSIPKEKKVVIALELNPMEDPLLVWGHVKWVKSETIKGMFRVGVQFTKSIDGSKIEVCKVVKSAYRKALNCSGPGQTGKKL